VLAEGGFPELRTMLCIGGIDMRTQMDLLKRGVHMVVATPGRLKDLLHKKRMNLDTCRYLCLDEADRMVDLGFEEEVGGWGATGTGTGANGNRHGQPVRAGGLPREPGALEIEPAAAAPRAPATHPRCSTLLRWGPFPRRRVDM
jgi:hypothetical protein